MWRCKLNKPFPFLPNLHLGYDVCAEVKTLTKEKKKRKKKKKKRSREERDQNLWII